MTTYSLIEPSGRVAQVGGDPFEVAPPLRWVECPPDVIASTQTYDEQTNTFISPPPLFVSVDSGPSDLG